MVLAACRGAAERKLQGAVHAHTGHSRRAGQSTRTFGGTSAATAVSLCRLSAGVRPSCVEREFCKQGGWGACSAHAEGTLHGTL